MFGKNNSSAAKAALIRNKAGKWVSGMTGHTAVPANVTLPSALDGLRWPSFTLATSGVAEAEAQAALLIQNPHLIRMRSVCLGLH